jgi:hypothetical protein
MPEKNIQRCMKTFPPPTHQESVGRNCWATCADGKPCATKVDNKITHGREETINGLEWAHLPYCGPCMQSGDPSVKAIPHPTKPIGNILVATRDLPKGYRFVYWGTRVTGKAKAAVMKTDDRLIEFLYGSKYCGDIDPGPHKGSVLQFAGSPGPNEYFNMVCSPEHFGLMDDKLVGRMYYLIDDVKKGHQIAHDYGKGWFEQRDMKPINIDDPTYPVPKKLSTHLIWKTQAGRYCCKANVGNKSIFVGTFDTEQEAIRAQAAAESGSCFPAKKQTAKAKASPAKTPAKKKAAKAKASPAKTPAKTKAAKAKASLSKTQKKIAKGA